LSPEGAGRNGAFREAKRRSGIPVCQQPVGIKANDKNRDPGKIYEFQDPKKPNDPKAPKIEIRDDYKGHTFPDDPSQNRGPHFNDQNGGHYDY